MKMMRRSNVLYTQRDILAVYIKPDVTKYYYYTSINLSSTCFANQWN